MKLNIKFLIFTVLFTLIIVIVNQLFWVYNMYRSYQQELVIAVDACIEKAIYMEVSERINIIAAPFIIRYSPQKNGVSEKVTRRIQTEDTTFVVEVDKNDQNVNSKIVQYLIHKDHPLNVNKLNVYLQHLLVDKGFSINNSYIEYFDLKTGKIIYHNKPKGIVPFLTISTDTIPIDILNTIGIKAYVESSPQPILKKMIFQLLLSLVLILIAFICLSYLLRTIFSQQKFEKMRQNFVNAMVHEFKRPISSAFTMINLVPYYLKKQDMAKVDAYLDDTKLEFNKLTAYIERIQRINNNESDTINLDKTAIDLSEFFERIKNKHAGNSKKSVDIDLHLLTQKSIFQVDLLHFSNVMDNLVENAIKYSDDPVKIVLTVSEEGHNLKISVKDNGFGISDYDKKHIFDKFYRVASKSVQKQSGFGLGLTYVKAIVEAHGGSVSVADALENGSDFIVILPS
ncbi:MAG: HAMP domain-containing sensor histidine kinase [Bacteroidales bacterium]|nr:HAMP domain-containing sensor histidine kinase [Bacteroidales bacterium]